MPGDVLHTLKAIQPLFVVIASFAWLHLVLFIVAAWWGWLRRRPLARSVFVAPWWFTAAIYIATWFAAGWAATLAGAAAHALAYLATTDAM